MKAKNKNLRAKIVLGLATFMFAGGVFLFFGCKTDQSEQVFVDSQLVLSVGDELEFSDFAKNEFDGSIVSSDEKIVAIYDNKIKVLSTGTAQLFAMQGKNRLSYIKIVVKDKFLTPNGIRVDASGKITWNKSSAFVSGVQNFASYQIMISGGSYEDQIIDTDENFYQLLERGEFEVCVRAVANNSIDASDWSEKIKIYNTFVEAPSDVTFTTDNSFGSTKGTLSFNGDQQKYKVYINNICYETGEDFLTIDFKDFKTGTYPIVVEAFDKEGKLLPYVCDAFYVTKLENPSVFYEDGYFKWQEVEGATGYYVSYENESEQNVIFTEDCFTYLEGAESGVYTINVQAVGDLEVLNSNVKALSNSSTKLENFEAEFSREDDVVTVSIFSQSENLKRFAIYVNDEKVDEVFGIYAEEGVVASKSRKITLPGRYVFKVQALPESLNDPQNYVLGSDFSQEFIVYKLAKPGEIVHSINQQGESIFEFDEVENADKYIVKINGIEISDFEVFEENQKVFINTKKIDRDLLEILDGESFDVEITATRRDGEVISSSQTKQLTVLSAPEQTKLNGSYNQGNIFAWTEVENAGKYRCELFKVEDESFNISNIEPQVFETTSNQTDELLEGYYVLRVYSLTTNENSFLDSSEYFEDRFIVPKQIDCAKITNFDISAAYPQISFEVDSLTDKRNYERCFEIYLQDENNEELLSRQAVSVNGGIYRYQFNQQIDFEEGYKTIKIKLVCNDEIQKKIYLDSELATLKLEKLKTPTALDVSVSEDQILKLIKKENSNKTLFTFEGQSLLTSDQEPLQEIDLKAYGESFSLKMKYLGYKDYTEGEKFTNGNYYTDSESFELNFVRGLAPSDFKYENSKLSLEMDEKYYDYFVLTVLVKSLNDSAGKTFITKIYEKEILLDDLLEMVSDPEFSSYYNQKTGMHLSVYSFKNSFDENDAVYYLPSFNSVATDQGVSTISITTLEAVQDLSYQKSSNKLLWTSENLDTETTYDIILNSSVIASVNIPLSKQNGISSYAYSLNEIDFLEGREYRFSVIARSKNHFDSYSSNVVSIERVSALDKITVSSSVSDKTPKILWNVDVLQRSKIKGVMINETMFESFAGSSNIDTQTQAYSIKLVAKDSYLDQQTGVNYYFIDSKPSLFTLINAKNEDYIVDTSLEDSVVKWTAYLNSSSQILHAEEITYEKYKDLLSYRVVATYNENISRHKDLNAEQNKLGSKNYLSLSDDIFLGATTSSDIKIYAFLNDYSLSRGGKGIYLCEKISNEGLRAERLSKVTNLSYSLNATPSTTIAEEKARKIRLSWDFDTAEDVWYEISYGNYTGESAKTTQNKYFDIAQEEITDDTIVHVRVLSSAKIPSEFETITLVKAKSFGASLSDQGVLLLNDQQNDNEYIISVGFNENHFDIVSSEKSIDVFDCLKLTNLLDETNLEVRISYVAVGKTDAILQTNDEITKNVLLTKSITTDANQIYFDASFADSVVVVLKDGDEITNQRISSKTDYYSVSNAGFEAKFGASTKNEYSLSDFEEQKVFVFDASTLKANQKFGYYFEKSGYVNSWYDRELSEVYKTATKTIMQDITDVKLSLDGGVVGKVESNQEVEKIVVDIKFKDLTKEYFFARVEFDGDEFDLESIENALGTDLLKGEYHFNIYSTKSNVLENEFACSPVYDLKLVQLGNTISNVHIDETGMLSWDDEEDNEYVILQNSSYFNVTGKSFDIRKLVYNSYGYEFKIACIKNLKFNEEELSANLLEEAYIPSKFKTVQISKSRTSDFEMEVKSDASVKLVFGEEIEKEDLEIYAEVNNKTFKLDFEEVENDQSSFVLKYPSIFEKLKDEFDDELSFVKIFATKKNCIKSTSKTLNLSIIKNSQSVNSSITRLKSDDSNFDDLISYASDLENAKYAWIKVLSSNGEVLSFKSYEFEDGKLNITKILDQIAEEGTTYSLSIAPVHLIDNKPVQIEWLETLEYTRLLSVNSFKLSAEGISWQKIENNLDQTGYAFLGAIESPKLLEINTTSLSHSQINAQNLDLSILTYSNKIGVLSSKKQTINITKASVLSSENFKIENGVLSMTWGDMTDIGDVGLLSDEQKEAILNSGNIFKILQLVQKTGRAVLNYTEPQLVEKILNTMCTTPTYFTLKGIENASITLNFRNSQRGYLASVKAVQILERWSEDYINILVDLSNSVGVPSTQKYQLNTIIDLLRNEKYFSGVACDKVLFDDIGDGAAEDIQNGLYKINAWTNSNEDMSLLRGSEATIVNDVEVLRAPVMKGYSEDVLSSYGEVLYSKYYLKFKTIQDQNSEDKTTYKMVLRSGSIYFEDRIFEISFDDLQNKFIINISGNSENKIYLDFDENDYLMIPLNTRGEHKGIDSLCDMDVARYSVSIYAIGNDRQLNGKSDIIKLSYLSINDIYLNLGKLSWEAFSQGGVSYDTRVIYSQANATQTKTVEPNQTNSFDLNLSTKYNYVAFMTIGKVQDFEINVDSKIIMLKNVVKLSSPQLFTNDGKILIIDSAINDNYINNGYERRYIVQNDKSNSAYILTENKEKTDYYLVGELYDSHDQTYAYRQTEFGASEFFFENAGSNSSLAYKETETTTDLGEVEIWKLQDNDNSNIFLRSDSVSIKARMIQDCTPEITSNGDISWNVAFADVSTSSYRIVYTVNIEAYLKSLNANNEIIYQIDSDNCQTLYTTENWISSDLINLPTDSTERFYKISVTAMVYELTGQDDFITTLSNVKYYKTSNLKYSNSDINILRSGRRQAGDPLSRVKEVYDINVDSLGNIEWSYTEASKTLVYVSKTENIFDAQQILGETVNVGTEKALFDPNVELDNSLYYIFVKAVDSTCTKLPSASVRSSQRFYKLPTFKESDLNVTYVKNANGTTQYRVDLSAYKDSLIELNGTKNYFILHADIKIGEKEFNKVEIYPQNMTVVFVVGDGEDDPSNKRFYLNGQDVELTLIAKQYSSEVARVINSEESQEIKFSTLSFSSEDNILWNEQDYSLSWTYGKQTQTYLSAGTEIYALSGEDFVKQSEVQEKSFCNVLETEDEWTKIVLNESEVYVRSSSLKEETTFRDTSEILFDVEVVTSIVTNQTSRITEEYIVTRRYSDLSDLSLKPDLQGKIIGVYVRAKGGAKNFASEQLSFEQEIDFKIFESGNGTESNPYKITNASQFEKLGVRASKSSEMISYKESSYTKTTFKDEDGNITNQSFGAVSSFEDKNSGNIYYFKLENDITLESVVGSFITSEFFGSLDASNHSITFNGSGSYETSNSFENDGSVTESFSQGFALFKKLGEQGVIKNLNLKVSYIYNCEQNLLVSGLTLENNGTIDNVCVKEFSFVYAKGVNPSGKLAVAPIVSLNAGILSNCKNEANMTIVNGYTSQSTSKQFFAGLALANSGLVYACENSGDISISITASSNVSVILGGILGLNIGGNLERCSSTGNLTVLNSAGNSRIGGIVYYTKNGSMRYCWNTSTISGNNAGGIAYKLERTSLYNSLAYGSVNSSTTNVFFYTAVVGVSSNNYTYPSYIDNRFSLNPLRDTSVSLPYSTVTNLITEKITGAIEAEYDEGARTYSVSFNQN